MPATIEDKSRALLQAKNFANVSTLRADGSILSVVAWVDVDGDTVVLNSAEGRAWPTNLRRDPRVTLTVANGENPYEYVTIRGRLSGATHDGADDHIDAMALKYMGKESYPFRTPDEQRLILRITPDKVSHWGA